MKISNWAHPLCVAVILSAPVLAGDKNNLSPNFESGLFDATRGDPQVTPRLKVVNDGSAKGFNPFREPFPELLPKKSVVLKPGPNVSRGNPVKPLAENEETNDRSTRFFDPAILPNPPLGEVDRGIVGNPSIEEDEGDSLDDFNDEGTEERPDVGEIPDPPGPEEFVDPIPTGATFDLASGVTPDYDGYKPHQVQLAAANFLLNSLSSHPKMVTIHPNSLVDGKVAVENFGRGTQRVSLNEIFNLGKIQELIREGTIKNPYQCVGDDRYTFRMDWLIATLMAPEVYSEMLGLSGEWPELARRLGVDPKPPGEATDNPNKVWVQSSMISSSKMGRVLEFQDQRGKINRVVLRSTDFPRTPKPGREAEFSDPRLHPNDYEGAAGEFIFNLPNGMFAFKLANKDGGEQPEAPASIVVNDSSLVGGEFPSNHHGSEISAPRDCMRCHRSGPIGQDYMGDWNIKDELAPMVKQRLITEQEAKEAEDRYTTGENYSKQMLQIQANYLKKLKTANAFIGDEYGFPVPLLPDFEAVYNEPLSFKQVAHELGLNKADLKKSLLEKANESLRDRLGVSIVNDKIQTEKFKIDRHIFEKIYCELKEGLVGESPLINEPVEDEGPLVNEPVHSPVFDGGTFR